MQQPRRVSYGDEEKIVIKPSTELIADEYEHYKTTNKIAVHTFDSGRENDIENVNSLLKILDKNDYQIKDENRHKLGSDNIQDILQNISNEANAVDGIILFFSGCYRKQGTLMVFNGKEVIDLKIEEIWNKFTTYNCMDLKNKPKIFIFQVTYLTTVQTDSAKYRSLGFESAYETPAEADILIVYNTTENSDGREFTTQLCENINDYGEYEDFISLVTCTENIPKETRPLIISTLTRKFYVTASEYRGYHFTIDQSHVEVKNRLHEIDGKLTQIHEHPDVKKKKFNFSFTKRDSTKAHSSKEEDTKSDDNFKRDANVRYSERSKQNVGKTTKTETDGLRSSTRKSLENSSRPKWRNIFKH